MPSHTQAEHACVMMTHLTRLVLNHRMWPRMYMDKLDSTINIHLYHVNVWSNHSYLWYLYDVVTKTINAKQIIVDYIKKAVCISFCFSFLFPLLNSFGYFPPLIAGTQAFLLHVGCYLYFVFLGAWIVCLWLFVCDCLSFFWIYL